MRSHQAARNESTIFRRAARTRGRNPPTSPITTGRTQRDARRSPGVRWKPNASWREGLPVHRRDVKDCMNDASDEPDDAADERQQHRLEQERGEDRRAAEAERAQRADLADAVRDRRVHRDHRADHRADREDDREREAEDADEVRERLRLLLVEERARASRRASGAGRSSSARLERVEAGRDRRAARSPTSTPCAGTPASSGRRRPRPPSRSPSRRRRRRRPPSTRARRSAATRRCSTPSKRSATLLPDDDLGRARAEHAAPATSRTCGRSAKPLARHARARDVRRPVRCRASGA